jgi:hypothetical protein
MNTICLTVQIQYPRFVKVQRERCKRCRIVGLLSAIAGRVNSLREFLDHISTIDSDSAMLIWYRCLSIVAKNNKPRPLRSCWSSHALLSSSALGKASGRSGVVFQRAWIFEKADWAIRQTIWRRMRVPIENSFHHGSWCIRSPIRSDLSRRIRQSPTIKWSTFFHWVVYFRFFFIQSASNYGFISGYLSLRSRSYLLFGVLFSACLTILLTMAGRNCC